MSSLPHHKEIVSFGSPYSGRTDPVTRDQFKTGDNIIVCDNKGEAIALSSISKIDNCPFCGGDILQQAEPVYPSIDTGYTIWETLLFSLLIGGVSGWVISTISTNNDIINYLGRTFLIFVSILLTMVVTKQSFGAVFAVATCNLLPVFTSKVSLDTNYLVYFILSIIVAWLVSANIKPFFR